MRVALLSDIHGNSVALDTVLQSLDRESVDQVVCLGDVAATGPRPHEALDRIRARKPLCVMGNSDEWLIKPTPYEGADEKLKVIEEVDSWCSQQLTESDKDFLRTFKPVLEVSLGDEATLLAFHGSPRSYYEWIPSAASDDELETMFSGSRATVMAGGHSHRQMLRRYRDTILLNPGSVGQPYERDHSTGKLRIPPWSEYAIISYERNVLDITFRRVTINLDDVIASILDSNMPYKETFLETWVSHIESILVEYKLT